MHIFSLHFSYIILIFNICNFKQPGLLQMEMILFLLLAKAKTEDYFASI